MKYITIIFLIILLILYVFIPIYMILTTFIRPKSGKYKSAGDIYKQFDEINTIGREYILAKNPEEVEVKSFDNLSLRGLLQINDETSNKFVICVHGFQSSSSLHDHGMTAKYVEEKHINCLYVDDRAHGKSDGRVIGFSVLDYKDVLVWMSYLTNRFPNCKILLYGISMGAATVLNCAPEVNNNVKGIIADCPFASGYDQVKHNLSYSFKLPKSLIITSNLFMKLICGYFFNEVEPKNRVKQSKVPILLIHGEEDRFVPTRMSKQIYENINSDKKLVIVPHARHAMSYLTDKDLYEGELTEFINKTLY